MNAEGRRLVAARTQATPWRKWGPYLSERQWGTVREDYGTSGDAWTYLSHDLARSFAYRWGEDGIAGISDDSQILCFALALWNGRDPIVKERLFGLTNHEGNHGEDVKEYYFYLDSTPTHSYMRYLYKYPQAPFPYADLVETNRRRSRADREYELIDTGVFDDDSYFDVFVEYAKAGPEDLVDRDHRLQPRRERGNASSAADAVVPKYLAAGQSRKAGHPGRRRTGRGAGSREPEAGQIRVALPARRGAAVRRQRDQSGTLADERREQSRRGAFLLQGRNQRIRDRRARGDDQPETGRDQGRRALHGRDPAGRATFAAPAPDQRGGRGRRRPTTRPCWENRSRR